MTDPNLHRPPRRPTPATDPGRCLDELLKATEGMGPSLERAIEMLDEAMGFTPHPRVRRFRIRVAVNDIFECAVRDAVAAIAAGAAGRKA